MPRLCLTSVLVVLPLPASLQEPAIVQRQETDTQPERRFWAEGLRLIAGVGGGKAPVGLLPETCPVEGREAAMEREGEGPPYSGDR